MHDRTDSLHRLCDRGHLRDVPLYHLDARLTLQPGEIAHRQIKHTHRMPISPATRHQAAANTPSPTRDENRATHVMVVPSILAFVTSAFAALSSFSTAAGRLDHFWSATSAATAAASVLQAFVGGTLIM